MSMPRRVGVPTIYMLLGNLFTLVVGLPFQIYVARVLGPQSLGVYGVLDALMVTLAGLLAFGIGSAVVRFVPEHLTRGEYGAAIGLIRGGAILLFTAGAAAYTILLLSLPWISTLFPWIEAYRREMWIMGLLIPLSLLAFLVQQALRGFQEIRYIAIGTSVLQLVLKVALTLGVFAIGWGLEGYLIANVLALTGSLAWLSYGLIKHIRALPPAVPDYSSLQKWWRFALASYLGSLIDTATFGMDRFLLAALVGSGAVGVLVVVRQLQMLPERFNQMLLIIGAPLFAAAHGRDDRAERQNIYHLMTDWTVRAALPLVLFLWFFGRDALALFGRDFADAGTLMLWILVGAQLFSLVCGPVGNIAMMSGLEWGALRLHLINTIFLVVAFAALTPIFGLIGIAIAYALATVSMNLVLLILVQRKLSVRWYDQRYFEWLPQCLGVSLTACIALILPRPLNAMELAAFLGAMYMAALGVTLFRGLHEDDKLLVKHVQLSVWPRLRS